jgi:kinesin family member 5
MSSTRNNVKVCCRFRPANKLETSLNDPKDPKNRTVDVVQKMTIKMLSETGQPMNFTFDQVFEEDSLQKDVFEYAAAPLVDEVMLGFNVTLFAYGQTGSGKTHTMMGVLANPDLSGIIPRIVASIFDQLSSVMLMRNSWLFRFQTRIQR